MSSEAMNQDFYWQMARDSLSTTAALMMFQIAVKHDGEDFDKAKNLIDREYEVARGRGETQRHGGNFQTFIRVFEEAGWMSLESRQTEKIIQVTPAGFQAIQLLISTPDFLKAAPYFLIELLSRYQLNNPTGPDSIHNRAIREAKSESNVFPYWTIWKIMRSCNNHITTEELRRFVFRLQRSEDIENAILQIQQFRRDKARGEDIDGKYPPPLEGANGEPKYIMNRAGVYVGDKPSLIEKPDPSTYELKPAYLPFIDKVLENEPVFKEYLDSETWIRDYGEPVLLEPDYVPFSLSVLDPEARLDYGSILDNDPIWLQVQELITAQRKRNILFIGPPGTSKTTYALAMGAKLADYQPHRFHNIQFHQSFGYEDFMEGYVPSESNVRGNGFENKEKVFLKACRGAARDSRQNLHVLVIDELNRGEPSRIFGEALTYIERRDEVFDLSFSGRRVIVPANLVILATMNPLDRSIAELDQALDRRFAKIFMDPDVSILRSILIGKNQMDERLAGLVVNFFEILNAQMGKRVGQAYFKDAQDLISLKRVWDYELAPLLKKDLRHDQEKYIAIEKEFDRLIARGAQLANQL